MFRSHAWYLAYVHTGIEAERVRVATGGTSHRRYRAASWAQRKFVDCRAGRRCGGAVSVDADGGDADHLASKKEALRASMDAFQRDVGAAGTD